MFRDFVYLDTDRIQSIIAQLEEGVLTQIMTGKGTDISGNAGLAAGILTKLLPVSLGGSVSYQSNLQSSKVLHDYAFNIALNSLKEKGYLLEAEDWKRDETLIPPTAFVLVRGSASILDYSILRNLAEHESALKAVGIDLNARQNSNTQRPQTGSAGDKETEPTFLQQMKVFLDVFMGDSLQVRIKYSDDIFFAAPLLRQFLREEIRHFIFKYGGGPQEGWTMLAQICQEPTQENKFNKLQEAVKILEKLQSNLSTGADMFNGIVEFLNSMQEAIASVSYPAIAVTPIAIYRELEPLD